METRASQVLVGAFTLAILVVGALLVLWLGKLRFSHEWASYDVVFSEPVTGLMVGSSVHYSGVPVGEVRRIALSTSEPGQVVVRVRVSTSTPVVEGTRARLGLLGLTGVAVVQMLGGHRNGARLQPRPGAEVARILAEDSSMQKLITSGEAVLTSADATLRRLQRLLSTENLSRVAATLDHVERISGQVAAREVEVGQAIENLAHASGELRTLLQRSTGLVGRLGTVADSSDRLLNGEARRTLESARRLADQAAAMLTENRESVRRFSEGDLQEVGPVLRDLREALRGVRELSDQLRSDPRSLLVGSQERPRERRAR